MSDEQETGKQDNVKTDRAEEYDQWKGRQQDEPPDPRESFKQVSHIALCMSYDLIDKLRWLEKDTLGQSDEEIAKRIPHMGEFLDRLKTAYLHFSDVDL